MSHLSGLRYANLIDMCNHIYKRSFASRGLRQKALCLKTAVIVFCNKAHRFQDNKWDSWAAPRETQCKTSASSASACSYESDGYDPYDNRGRQGVFCSYSQAYVTSGQQCPAQSHNRFVPLLNFCDKLNA